VRHYLSCRPIFSFLLCICFVVCGEQIAGMVAWGAVEYLTVENRVVNHCVLIHKHSLLRFPHHHRVFLQYVEPVRRIYRK
jgi:hypothetical protein